MKIYVPSDHWMSPLMVTALLRSRRDLEDRPAELYTRAERFSIGCNGQLYLGERRVMSTEGPMVLPDFELCR
ncbi:hypothetical protein OK016_27530 [Vibrio chagasii]|nr:hypothetical protein [Vibrio chagasii]